jgi:acetoin utilization deacetylase AcuC-like enzyme
LPGRVFSADEFVLPLPPGHRFPMEKYGMLRAGVAAAELVPSDQLRVPDAASEAELCRVHAPEYVTAVMRGTLSRAAVRRIGFPWSPQLVERSRRSVGGTIAAARAALEAGTGVSLAGGTHHAFADLGEGYCVFNDAAVAVRVLQAERRIRRALIVDTDVHQGNGTAAMFRDDATVFTLDVYGRDNFPFQKEAPDLAVELPDGTGDAAYLAALDPALRRALAAGPPDLAVYVSGADPFVGDRLGRLALTQAGLAARDRLVLDTLRAEGVPVAVVMGGGYAEHIADTVAIHLATVRAALSTRRERAQGQGEAPGTAPARA